MLLEICVSLVFVGVICDNSKLYIRPFSFCLVLNTVEKMHRWELRMNFYTVVLNTNQKNKVDKIQLTGNGTTIHTLCLYKDINDGKLYLQVNWNEGIIYIRPDQIS